jgi:hypothetical protein
LIVDRETIQKFGQPYSTFSRHLLGAVVDICVFTSKEPSVGKTRKMNKLLKEGNKGERRMTQRLQKFHRVCVLLAAFLNRGHSTGQSRDADAIKVAKKSCEKVRGVKLRPEYDTNPLELLKLATKQEMLKWHLILIRTQNYEAADLMKFLLSILRSFDLDYLANERSIQTIYPEDVREIGPASSDDGFEAVMTFIGSESERHWIIVVGNASIADYLLGLLSVVHPETKFWSPILACRRYPI